MNTAFRRILSLVCLVIFTGGSAFAEDLPELQTGARIRATYVERSQGKARIRQITGRFEGITDCTLNLSSSSGEQLFYVPRERITQLERSIHPGSRGHALTVGFLAGASLGAILIIPSLGNRQESGGMNLGDSSFLLGAACILAGTAIGALIGAGRPAEKWQEVDASSVDPSHEAEAGCQQGIQLTFYF
jgi:hypothetical protein